MMKDVSDWSVIELHQTCKNYSRVNPKFEFTIKCVGDRVYLIDGRPEFRA
jgi:hypothetical protein